MLSALALLLLNGLFFTLRLDQGGNSFPRPLKPEEERICLEAAEKGDLEARNKLIEHNLRLVAHIMKKYYTQNGDQDDLISIGTIGLIKAINTYRSDRNIKLATYASRCIENAMLTKETGGWVRACRCSKADQTALGGVDKLPVTGWPMKYSVYHCFPAAGEL